MTGEIFVYPDPASHAMSLAPVERVSATLATQLAACVARYSANRKRWSQAPATVRTAVSRLVPGVARIVGALPDAHQACVRRDGLDALESEEHWAHLEAACHHTARETRSGPTLVAALRLFNALHRDNPSLKSPSVLQLRGGDTDVWELYNASASFLLDYKRLIVDFDARGETAQTGMLFKHRSYSLLVLLLRDGRAAARLQRDGFDAFALHPPLLKKAESHRTWQAEPTLITLLGQYDPDRWKRKTVTVFGHVADLTELHRFSPTMFADLVEHAARLGPSPPAGLGAISARDSLTLLQRVLPRFADLLSPEDLDAVQARGFVAFVENDSRRLAAMYGRRHLVRGAFVAVKAVADSLFPQAKREAKQLAPYQVTFTNRYAERPTYCDFGPFRELSVRLYDDLVELVKHLQATLSERSYGEATVYHECTQLRAAFALCRSQLPAELVRMLQRHGLKAFNRPGLKLQKAMYAILQNAGRTGVVSTMTAYHYKTSLIWFMTQCGFRVVDAYPISQTKTAKHLQRLNTDDYYTVEQCRELAYHVECLLADPAIAGEYRLALMLARVLLKTGWNLSATLDIECSDIVRAASPLNPHGAISVVLRKPRAGYRSDAYTFAEPHTGATSMRSAVTELLQVRDELTAGLRSSLPDTDPYKAYVFLFEKSGNVQRLSMASLKVVSALLARRGCVLTFDSKKIRKGGVNHLYRQVQKNLQAYEDAAKHDFATFEAHYYRVDQNQARYALGKAIDVMGKYFTGKEISKDIVIVTRPRDDLQHTPMGECASAGVDRDAAIYNIEHKRLHAERGSAAKFCADFLGCIWCKFFRLVADPDHVWRLLSYRDFVLQSMQASVLGDPEDEQQTHIDILKARVSQMLERLNARTPGVTAKAEALLRDRGMHPDWAFALIDVPIGQME